MKITVYPKPKEVFYTEVYKPTKTGFKLIQTMRNGLKRNEAYYANSEQSALEKIHQLVTGRKLT